ncbi:MAG: glycerate kinase [Christensenella sp.]|nr:glycerate kinase [Christensenella sp.]
MKNFILAPDSFKGTMSADTVSSIWSTAIRKHIPDAKLYEIPLSDGGEGMVDAFLRVCGGEKKFLRVTGPMGSPVKAAYGILPDSTAVVEMAACAGLPLVQGEKDPSIATTYGLGEMISQIASDGISKVILGIGGSATNDCGIGMAAALGYLFYDERGNKLEPLAKNMSKVTQISKPSILPNIDLTVACDVDNPLFGKNGATYTFGPQKGVAGELLELLDAGLMNMARVIKKDLHADVADLPGAGAAGGLGAGVVAFLNGDLRPGIDLLLDALQFDSLLKEADIVFVGEGRMDWQSAHGKAPIGIARRAAQKGVPCIALCGSIGKGIDAVYDEGISAVFASAQGSSSLDEIIKTCEEDMRRLADSVVRVLCLDS